MQILEQGRARRGKWTMKMRCTGHGTTDRPGCDALLLIVAEDLFRVLHDPSNGDIWHHAAFECPLCHAWTEISTNADHYNIPFDKLRKLEGGRKALI